MNRFLIILLVLMIASPAFADAFGFGRSVITGQLTQDAAATTGVVLSADESRVRRLIIRPIKTNANDVYISGSAYNANDGMGFILTGDQTVVIDVTSTNAIYLRALEDGDGVSWIGIVK